MIIVWRSGNQMRWWAACASWAWISASALVRTRLAWMSHGTKALNSRQWEARVSKGFQPLEPTLENPKGIVVHIQDRWGSRRTGDARLKNRASCSKLNLRVFPCSMMFMDFHRLFLAFQFGESNSWGRTMPYTAPIWRSVSVQSYISLSRWSKRAHPRVQNGCHGELDSLDLSETWGSWFFWIYTCIVAIIDCHSPLA